MGNAKEPALKDLDKILHLLANGMEDMIEQMEKNPFGNDPMVEQYLDRLTIKRVHLAAGSSLPDNYILYQSIALYEKHGLSSELYKNTREILQLDKRTGIEIIEQEGEGFKVEE